MEQVAPQKHDAPRAAKPEARSNVETTVVIPWQERMVLGVGLQAITGMQRQRAIEPLPVVTESAHNKTVTSHVEIVEHENDILKLLDTTASSSFDLYCIDYGIDSELISSTRCSKKQVSIVARQQIEFSRHLPGDYRLTQEAAAVRDAAVFRRRFGDYFVAGYTKSAVFYAIYNCSSSSVRDMQRFAGEVRASRSDGFDAAAATSLARIAALCNVGMECTVLMSGTPDRAAIRVSVEPGLVVEQMSYFGRIATGAPSHAILWHYSLISDVLQPKIDVSPSTMLGLADLYRKTRCATVLIAGFPPRDEERDQSRYTQLERRFDTLRYEIQFRLDELTHDNALLNDLLSQVSDWLYDAHVVMSWQDLRDKGGGPGKAVS